MTARQRWSLLVVLSLGLLLIAIDGTVLYTALPTLATELGASGSETLWIMNAYPLVMAGLLLGSGTLGDRVGHRRMFLIGLVTFGLSSLLAAFSPTPWMLILARGLLAVGAAAMMPATLALIRVTFVDTRERNVAIAVWGAISLAGAALGPVFGGVLLEFFWWGSVFLINVPVAILAYFLTRRLAPADRGNPSSQWDLVSSVLAMIALAALVLLIKESANPDRGWVMITAAAVLTLLAGFLFVRRQRRLTQPLLDFSIFRSSAVASGVVASILCTFALGGVDLVLVQRFQLADGMTPLESGFLVAAAAAGMIPASLGAGALLHHLGLRLLIGGGFALATIGGITVMATINTQNKLLIAASLVLLGLGLGTTMGVASTAILGNVRPQRAGMAASVEEVSYEFGTLTAIAIIGSVLNAVYSANLSVAAGVPTDSLASTLAARGDDPAVVQAALGAFDQAFTVVLIIAVGVLAVATIATTLMLRRYGIGTESSKYETVH